MISTRTHGIIDYIVGILLIAAPWLFGFADVGGAAVNVPVVLGIIVLGQSLLTRYEYGLIKVIPFSVHLMLDVLVGLVLILSPWLFGFADQGTGVWLPHVIVGAGELLAVAMSQRTTTQAAAA